MGRLGTVVDHVDVGPIALALLKRGLPADTELTTGGEAQVAAVIDADSMPAADVTGAGRLAVERLRGGTAIAMAVPTKGLPAHRSRAR